MARAWTSTIVAALTATLAGTACSDLHLSASDLEVAPSPAVPGDTVVAAFMLSLVPTQEHTIIVVIDGTEYTRVTRSEPPPIPVVLELGDAAELLAQYGTGTHSAHIEVHASEANEIARSGSAIFELEQAAP